jgi:hypothetical protein
MTRMCASKRALSCKGMQRTQFGWSEVVVYFPRVFASSQGGIAQFVLQGLSSGKTTMKLFPVLDREHCYGCMIGPVNPLTETRVYRPEARDLVQSLRWQFLLLWQTPS